MNFPCENIAVKDGRLTFAGQDAVSLAKRYGTPLYLMDEDRLRRNMRLYADTLRETCGENARALYASKANSFAELYRIAAGEGMGVDVVSCGEIATAKKAGYPLSDAWFHGNNKTDEDIRYAMDNGVGCFVADNPDEIVAVEREAAARNIRQRVLLRVTPGIDPHTYEAVSTGKVDSKFGCAIGTGQAEEALLLLLRQPHLDLEGFHCHVGSQVFGEDVFCRAARVMLEWMAQMRDKHGFTGRVLDLGGGIGVPYVSDDPACAVRERLAEIGETLRETCGRLSFPAPQLLVEPGRSIVADAGMTLYTVGSVKHIPGYKTYVSVDGGMTDNPRYALYRSRYTCVNASKADRPHTMAVTVAGRCCESGDLIQEGAGMPEDTARGDILAVCTTGAYNYSMASNYNRVPRPPVVMLRDGDSRTVVRRETFDDLTALDL